MQFEGPGADVKPFTLCVEDQDYMGRIKKLQEYLEKVCSLPTFMFCSPFPHPPFSFSIPFEVNT